MHLGYPVSPVTVTEGQGEFVFAIYGVIPSKEEIQFRQSGQEVKPDLFYELDSR
jgi:hypothetical protein